MKKNGLNLIENFAADDGRVGYRWCGNTKDISKACDRFLEKRTPPEQKKRRRRFGNY